MSSLKEYLRVRGILFFCEDVAFCIIFLVVIFLKHDHSTVLYISACVLLASYYILLKYTRQLVTGKNKCIKNNEWHHNNEYTGLMFILFRALLLLISFASCFLDVADVEFIHTIEEFPTHEKVILLIMCFLLASMSILSYAFHKKHFENSRVYVSQQPHILIPVREGQIFNGETAEQASFRLLTEQ